MTQNQTWNTNSTQSNVEIANPADGVYIYIPLLASVLQQCSVI